MRSVRRWRRLCESCSEEAHSELEEHSNLIVRGGGGRGNEEGRGIGEIIKMYVHVHVHTLYISHDGYFTMHTILYRQHDIIMASYNTRAEVAKWIYT